MCVHELGSRQLRARGLGKRRELNVSIVNGLMDWKEDIAELLAALLLIAFPSPAFRLAFFFFLSIGLLKCQEEIWELSSLREGNKILVLQFTTLSHKET